MPGYATPVSEALKVVGHLASLGVTREEAESFSFDEQLQATLDANAHWPLVSWSTVLSSLRVREATATRDSGLLSNEETI